MKVYTARQAIYNRKQNVVAYELLFRDGPNNVFPKVETNSATSKLILDSHFNQGIEKITSGKPALINYPEKAILDGVPTVLPPNKAMVEILECVPPSAEVYEACRQLFHKGYKLVLDDFKYKKEWEPFLKLVRLIKFDLRETSFAEIESLLPLLRKYKSLKILAEKVETQEEFDKAKDLGFDFFQGYYFCKPNVVEQNDVSANLSVIYAMYQETLKDNVNYTKLSRFFEHDTSLSYKLLKFINSGLFPLRDPIGSIKQALVYLGNAQVKKFVNLIITAHIAEQKPQELTNMSIIRAKFCECLAEKVAPAKSDEAFILGLFSLLDAILDQPMCDIVRQLPLSEEVSDALIGHENVLGNILGVVKSYESGSWTAMRKSSARFRIEQEILPEFYATAIEWADEYKNINDSII
ncbi:MAG: HDOD domain-containing protein [Gammaproteobacteria bacterium]|nr:HDOD domain-containing protein [Gammaproteobacteria bacterium]